MRLVPAALRDASGWTGRGRSARIASDEAREPCGFGAIWVYVDDVGAVYKRVLEAGWDVEAPLEDKFWGERQFRVRDVNGNLLVIAQPTEHLKLEEIRERHQKTMNRH